MTSPVSGLVKPEGTPVIGACPGIVTVIGLVICATFQVPGWPLLERVWKDGQVSYSMVPRGVLTAALPRASLRVMVLMAAQRIMASEMAGLFRSLVRGGGGR